MNANYPLFYYRLTIRCSIFILVVVMETVLACCWHCWTSCFAVIIAKPSLARIVYVGVAKSRCFTSKILASNELNKLNCNSALLKL
jgi:hypothetical protein